MGAAFKCKGSLVPGISIKNHPRECLGGSSCQPCSPEARAGQVGLSLAPASPPVQAGEMLCQDLQVLGVRKKVQRDFRELLLPAGELGMERMSCKGQVLEQPCPGKVNAGGAGVAEPLPWDVALLLRNHPKFPFFLHSCKAKLAERNVWVLTVFKEREKRNKIQNTANQFLFFFP